MSSKWRLVVRENKVNEKLKSLCEESKTFMINDDTVVIKDSVVK